MLTNSIPYTFVRDGYYYFSRRVPADLQHHYRYPRIVQGLRTRSRQKAKVQAGVAAANLDAYWSQMRMAQSAVMGMSLVRKNEGQQPAVTVLGKGAGAEVPEGPTLQDALQVYLSQKGKGRPKSFRIAAERSCGYVSKVCGDKPLSAYSRQDALNFRNWLVDRGLTGSSVTRNFSYVKAVFNFATAEFALDIRNPFTGVYHDRSAGVQARKPIPFPIIQKIQAECCAIDDEMRWLVALISDTGMRLAEGAGLLKEDFIGLDGSQPCIRLVRHPWRNLKTASSERLVPLSGAALWAARRAVHSHVQSEFAFPRYNRTSTTAANSASAALNKWLKGYVSDGCTMHSFRHSMRDRLRSVQCPSDIVDQIGGWQTGGVGHSYGSGYPLEVLSQWMNEVTQHFGQYSEWPKKGRC